MAQRTITWTKTADIQFVGILEYWTKRNKSTVYSKKLIKLVGERTELIAIAPFIFRRADFPETRMSVLENYSIFTKLLTPE